MMEINTLLIFYGDKERTRNWSNRKHEQEYLTARRIPHNDTRREENKTTRQNLWLKTTNKCEQNQTHAKQDKLHSVQIEGPAHEKHHSGKRATMSQRRHEQKTTDQGRHNNMVEIVWYSENSSRKQILEARAGDNDVGMYFEKKTITRTRRFGTHLWENKHSAIRQKTREG